MSINESAGGARLGAIMEPDANSFGVLRFLLASLVLVSHAYMFTFGTSDAEPLHGWIGRSLGESAVQVFFILSGILVAQSFERSASVIDFATARVLRIFPALIVCVVLTVFVLGPLVSSLPVADYLKNGGTYAYVAKTLSLSTGSAPLPGVFDTVPYAGYVNSSLWTLKYEAICYTILGSLGLVGLFAPARRMAVILIATALLAAYGVFANSAEAAVTFLDNLSYFAVYFGMGVVFYLARNALPIHGIALVPLFGLFALSVGTSFQTPVAAVFLGYGALYAATKTFGPLRAWCNRTDASFGIYIYAGPVQQALLYAIPTLTPVLLIALSFAAVVPLALLSWALIERPALRLRRPIARYAARLVPVLSAWFTKFRPTRESA